MSISKSLALLCTLPFVAFGAGNPQKSQDFMLYGYSDRFGGSPLVYADVSFMEGMAYVGNADELNITDAAIVKFTSDSSNQWLASPNVTAGGDSSWSNATFFVPTAQNSDRRIGFVDANSTTENKITSGFRLYGSLAALVLDGRLETLWTGLQVGPHVHALYWNDTSLGQIPITLTNVAPSNPSD
ncbi:hypothetical protein yc1106_00901 [Curvularia clavata]|uniref:Uncharacterized protein n=1 Tax=Curvularia clavata TaxID=95742 RepID=A0A9Q9DNN1_CURCL|nr:hypothetical protein yc1106_00901 [Curvularia clavata]